MQITPINEVLTTNPYDKLNKLWADARNKEWYFSGFWQKTFITFCFIYTIISIGLLIWRLIT